MCNSWVILNRETMQPVMEFFNPQLVALVNLNKYEVMTTLEWLQMFNASVKAKMH